MGFGAFHDPVPKPPSPAAHCHCYCLFAVIYKCLYRGRICFLIEKQMSTVSVRETGHWFFQIPKEKKWQSNGKPGIKVLFFPSAWVVLTARLVCLLVGLLTNTLVFCVCVTMSRWNVVKGCQCTSTAVKDEFHFTVRKRRFEEEEKQQQKQLKKKRNRRRG